MYLFVLNNIRTIFSQHTVPLQVGIEENFSFAFVLYVYAKSRLLGASICAVPLSKPIPVKNYFQHWLSRQINVFEDVRIFL